VAPEKFCAACGRRMKWRRRWANNWEYVRYCSDRCRGAGVDAQDRALESAILRLLDARAGGASICPSEAARAVGGEDWRGLMERARCAARRLTVRGQVEITQRGGAVDASAARGPIRVRRVRR
jgi:hypothetical protein